MLCISAIIIKELNTENKDIFLASGMRGKINIGKNFTDAKMIRIDQRKSKKNLSLRRRSRGSFIGDEKITQLTTVVFL